MEDKFLRLDMIMIYVCGIIHLKTKTTAINILHIIYSYFWYISGILFNISLFGEFHHWKETTMMTFIDNIRMSSLLIYAFFKYSYTKSKRLTALADHIRTTERKLLSYNDENINEIYWRNQKLHTSMSKYFCILSYWAMALFHIYPLYYSIASADEVLYDRARNVTIYLPRPTSFRGAFPFDKFKYFKATFFCHIIFGLFTCSATVVPDIFFWGLMGFGTTQIQVLQYRLKNFDTLSRLHSQKKTDEVESLTVSLPEKSSNRIPCLPRVEDDTLAYIYLQECITEHRTIIKYISDMDNSFKYLMLVDSVLSAVQMALIGLGCLLYGMNPRQFDNFQYLSWTVVQLFCFYYNANEILLAGLSLPDVIWESAWIDRSERVKKVLLFMMKRAGRPLKLNVGPFYEMSLTTMLSILKTAISYFLVMRQQVAKDKSKEEE